MDFESAKKYILGRLGQELPEHLSYHGFHHTLEVYENASRYADHYNIIGDRRKLLLTAALFHDSGFIYTYNGHEERSCRIAQENLPQFDYSADEISEICSMIMCTKIPQSPKSLLEKIICDSDLDYLGRDDFFEIGNELFMEFSTMGVVQDDKSWNRLQVLFLEGHKFHTDFAQNEREQKKKEHLEHIRKLVASYSN